MFNSAISPKGVPVLHAVQRHCSARQERLCWTVRLNDSIIDASVWPMALRIAGPMTGNNASASGCGSFRTDVVMLSSINGARE